jgi:TatD DNase family protein
MLIDTHAHVNFSVYKKDGDQVTKRALESDVWMINVGSQYDTSRRAVEYAQKNPAGVFASVALHPIHLKKRKINERVDSNESFEFESQEESFDYERYKELAKNLKAVAIGETGLDYYHLDAGEEESQKNLQKNSFIKHLELAKELSKPVIVHCREAHEDVLDILGAKASGYKLQGVIHSFSGGWRQAEQYLALGFYLGFNGIVTFARDYDKVIMNMPFERLVLETDCPYLTPIPFRGKRNEPLYVKYVAEKIAELRGVSFDEVAKITTENTRRLFEI